MEERIMWKQKIGISLAGKYPIPTADAVRMLKEIGFDAVSPIWKAGMDITDTINAARQCGLIIQSLHAPFSKAADMWSRNKDISSAALKDLLDALEVCEKFDIPVMVVHTWIGFEYDFCKEELYFANFDELICAAKQKGIKIAFENTEGEEFLYALMEHFENESQVGFCWDSGHELCYNHSKDLLKKYGEKLIMTHLNDNLGISRFDGSTYWTDDLHLLPYDGIADWDDNIERLRRSYHQEILNFELTTASKPGRHDNDLYAQMSLEEYYSLAYSRACRIAYIYSK